MKRSTIVVALLALLGMVLASCGGGGGGGGMVAGVTKGTFKKTVEVAVPTMSFGGMLNSASAEARYMMLFTASDVEGSGYVRSLRLRAMNGVLSAVTCTDITIKMGATTAAALDVTYDNNVNQGAGSLTTVLNSATVTIPTTTTLGYFNINLNTAAPFYYNGKDNLVVEVTRGSACSSSVAVGASSIASAGLVWAWGAAGTSTIASGTANNASMNAELVFKGGDDALDSGDTLPAPTPFASLWRTQMLYSADEVDGSGPITGLGMQVAATTVEGSYTYTLKLGHTLASALSTTFADNYHGSPATIVTNGTFTIPAGVPAGEYIWVPFPGTFNYNGKDNLLVDIDVSSATASNNIQYGVVGSAVRLVYGASGSSVATSWNSAMLNMKLRFNGGPLVKHTANTGSSNGVFNGMYSTATLYSATDLGTAGKITSVSCRLLTAPTGTSYAHFKVAMGHAAGSTLSGTTATDFANIRTVYNGTFVVPDGLLAGDWLNVPLSSPFAYDGKSNLIVWMGNGGTDPGTAAIVDCMGELNATRYPGGMGISSTGVGSASYSPINWSMDMLMNIHK